MHKDIIIIIIFLRKLRHSEPLLSHATEKGSSPHISVYNVGAGNSHTQSEPFSFFISKNEVIISDTLPP